MGTRVETDELIAEALKLILRIKKEVFDDTGYGSSWAPEKIEDGLYRLSPTMDIYWSPTRGLIVSGGNVPGYIRHIIIRNFA